MDSNAFVVFCEGEEACYARDAEAALRLGREMADANPGFPVHVMRHRGNGWYEGWRTELRLPPAADGSHPTTTALDDPYGDVDDPLGIPTSPQEGS